MIVLYESKISVETSWMHCLLAKYLMHFVRKAKQKTNTSLLHHCTGAGIAIAISTTKSPRMDWDLLDIIAQLLAIERPIARLW